MSPVRECDNEGCPYRSHGLRRGKRSGFCGMVRPMLAFGCPVRQPGEELATLRFARRA